MRAVAFVLLTSVFVACTEDPQTVQPQKVTRPSGDDDDDDDDVVSSSSSSSGGGGLVDAATGGAAVSYRGTLEKTGTNQFGGGTNHCTYNVEMKAVEIELAITPEGNVIGGTAKNDMVETIVGSCMYLPLGTKPMSFAYASSDGTTLTWAQTDKTAPKTNLTITLKKNGTGFDAGVKWLRTDATGDLQWSVSSGLTLAPK